MKKIIYIFIFTTCICIINIPNVISCTVFHVSNENVVFGGNNEDWSDPDTYIYFIPSSENEFGRAIVGYSGNYWIQGGMNEKGLFWDGLACLYLEVLNSAGKPYYNGHIFDYILDVCETCDEALAILDQYNMRILERAQILCGDRYGDSFIIEGDVNHNKNEYYQVGTNFYLSLNPNPPYPCWRYTTALGLFESIDAESLSLDFCSSVLDVVHQEGDYPTQYSTVYDLKNKLIYLYHNHNYNEVEVFNLTEELKLGYHSYSIPELFEGNLPPYKPAMPEGPSSGKAGTEYSYSSSATDPDGDQLTYKWFYYGEVGTFTTSNARTGQPVKIEKADPISRQPTSLIIQTKSPIPIDKDMKKLRSFFIVYLPPPCLIRSIVYPNRTN